MSDDVLVRAVGVSKKFCRELKRSLWYGVQDTIRDVFGRDGTSVELRRDEFWAANDVSFELRRGECLGLIGRNGAGKTTLLRMLSGLIKPDNGRIEVRGRVGALIALGAGFSPILTGRENVYVNGSVLGLSKKEIDAKYEEIVDFAEIGEFIDAPVQSYSSGMQVRLGFAVATALNPDILLLDEVLAVGDMAFRAKCYDRIAEIRQTAALILVSHSMEQIAQVCSKVLLLEQGKCRYLGEIETGIKVYNDLAAMEINRAGHEHVSSNVSAALDNCDEVVRHGGYLQFSLTANLGQAVDTADIKAVLWAPDGKPAFEGYTRTQGASLALNQGENVLECTIGPLHVKAGRYSLSVVLLNREDNRHIYWGDRIRVIEIDGPAAALAVYTPACSVVVQPHKAASLLNLPRVEPAGQNCCSEDGGEI